MGQGGKGYQSILKRVKLIFWSISIIFRMIKSLKYFLGPKLTKDIVLRDKYILEEVYKIDTDLNQLNHKSIESGIAADSYKLSKKELWAQIQMGSQYTIDQMSPPVIQFMSLFNKAMQIYGSLVCESLGFQGLILYAKRVVERLHAVYEQRIQFGYRANMMYYDGKQDQFDYYHLGLLQRLRDLYSLMIDKFSSVLKESKTLMISDKVRLICEELKQNIEKDDIKSLILAESSTVGVILAQIINDELRQKLKKRQISAKYYYISRLYDSACHSHFETEPRVPFEYEGFFNPEQMSLEINHDFRKDGSTYDLRLYESCLKEICLETLLISQKGKWVGIIMI